MGISSLVILVYRLDFTERTTLSTTSAWWPPIETRETRRMHIYPLQNLGVSTWLCLARTKLRHGKETGELWWITLALFLPRDIMVDLKLCFAYRLIPRSERPTILPQRYFSSKAMDKNATGGRLAASCLSAYVATRHSALRTIMRPTEKSCLGEKVWYFLTISSWVGKLKIWLRGNTSYL